MKDRIKNFMRFRIINLMKVLLVYVCVLGVLSTFSVFNSLLAFTIVPICTSLISNMLITKLRVSGVLSNVSGFILAGSLSMNWSYLLVIEVVSLINHVYDLVLIFLIPTIIIAYCSHEYFLYGSDSILGTYD